MQYSKTMKIKRIRLNKNDVLQLAKIIELQFSDNDYAQMFEIDFWDNSSISDSSLDVFMVPEIERKRAKRIRAQYYSHLLDKHIDMNLYDSTYIDDSEINISSNDQTWFESMTTKFSDVLQTVEKQTHLAYLFQQPYLLGAILGTCLSYYCVDLLVNTLNAWGVVLTNLMQLAAATIIMLLNFTLAIIASKGLWRAFPLVEFRFGPKHMNSGAKTRKAIIWSVATFAPSIILFVIEKIFFK